MPRSAPFKLGPFTVGDDGLLSPSGPESFPSLRVYWRGRTVQARLTSPPATLPGEGMLEMQARLGRVPSTADAEPTRSLGQREKIFADLHDLAALLPKSWHVRLGADHTINLERPDQITLPTSAVQLVTEVTLFLLSLDPYLDLLDTAGIGSGAAGRPGMAKTCPG
jgi:hypothetical protein